MQCSIKNIYMFLFTHSINTTDFNSILRTILKSIHVFSESIRKDYIHKLPKTNTMLKHRKEKIHFIS